MKINLLLLILSPLFVFAQQKSVTPITNNQTIATGTTYAVVVGISDYQDPGITDLRFADKDALAFANFLRSPAGGSLDADHLKVLTNEQATAGHIAEALDELIERAKKGDEVIIYFSGHGDVERKTVSQPGFLLCWDAPSRVYMGGGTFSLAFLQEIISTLSIQTQAKVIVVTDACHAGKLSGSQISGSQLTSANLAKQYANETKILSCQPNEYSLEGEQWGGGRGCFSYHLVEALYGLADRNNDGTVTVGEVDRYLEDHVTSEAAPQTQVPMLLGNKTERLSTVNAALLAELKSAKKGQLEAFASADSRGFEEDILALADTSVRKTYLAFKQALEDRHFFAPKGYCAEEYYNKLIQIEQLQPLRGAMLRGYAAALQDDAQQELNTLLKTGLTEEVLVGTNVKKLYSNYPAYLDRAAELLGPKHYMYASIQARKHFFKGKIQMTNLGARNEYHQALHWQPNMPHAYSAIIPTFEKEQADSAHYYAAKASELIPSWEEPYIQLFYFYRNNNQMDKAMEMLDLAGQVDSNSILVWYAKGTFYADNHDYELAEKWLLKSVQYTNGDICFPCAYNSLGFSYLYSGRFDEAEKSLLKALSLDSSHVPANLNIGNLYGQTGRFDKAEEYLLKTLQLDSLNTAALSNMGIMSAMKGQFQESIAYLKKAINIDPGYIDPYANLATLYAETGQYTEAEKVFLQMIKMFPGVPTTYFELGYLYLKMENYPAAETRFKEALGLDPKAVSAMYGLTVIYMKDGRLNEAKEMLDKALKIHPNSAELLILQSRWYIKNNQTEQAWIYLEEGMKAGKTSHNLNPGTLMEESDFEAMRKDTKWEELMKKYFPK